MLGGFHLFFNLALRNLPAVKNLGRILRWLLGGALVFAVVILLGVNLYVQAQGTHRRIQQELSQRLGTPLTLHRISITPWSGLQLSGIVIPQEAEKIGGDFLHAQTFQLRVQFWSLFSDRLVIRQVSLIKPEVLWAQNSAGKWRLPELPVEKRAPEPTPSVIAAPGPTLASSPQQRAAAPPAPSPNEERTATLATEQPSASFTPEVRRVTLRDGDFTFLDSAGRIVAKFSGLDFTSSFRTATALKGSTQIEKISLRDRFFIEHLDSPLHYDPALLAFSKISADTAEGKLNGSFQMQLQEVDSPFNASVKFHDLQAAKLLADAGGPPEMLTGRVEGFLDAEGSTADSNSIRGRGEIFLRDGTLRQYSLLVALGQILQIDELMQLHLEQAELHFHINPGIVTIDQLLLRSPNIRLAATGTIKFDGKLRLNAQLALNDKIRRQLFEPIRVNFVPVNEPAGYAAIDFHVSGTLERPKTDLMEKVVGHDLRDLGGVISSLFGHSKKKKPEPTATPTPTVSATPESSPNESSAAPTSTPTPTP